MGNKKSGNKKPSVEKILLITALANLITAIAILAAALSVRAIVEIVRRMMK